MTARQDAFRTWRTCNQWVANETLEDHALRFTAKRVRRWSGIWVASTALGVIGFLALEAVIVAMALELLFGVRLTLVYLFRETGSGQPRRSGHALRRTFLTRPGD